MTFVMQRLFREIGVSKRLSMSFDLLRIADC